MIPAHVHDQVVRELTVAAMAGSNAVALLAPLDPLVEPRALAEFRQALGQAQATFTHAIRLLEAIQ